MSASEALKNLKPAAIWQNFAALCDTPRPSGYIEKISTFMEAFGKQLNLSTIKDKTGNVIIKKPASDKQRQDEKPIILQAHLDMVPQSEKGNISFDFKTKGIEPFVQDDWVKAKDTTLGADNGIGVAMIMSVLASKDIKHGPIEALFTVEEETNQAGIKNLADNVLTGDTLINIDSASEDELCIGSAGGVKTHIKRSYLLETVDQHDSFRLSISGLKGGHSGCDIIHNRANAIELLARLLYQFQTQFDVHVSSIYGGSPVYNAIPRESYALITIPQIKTKHLLDELPKKQKEIAAEYDRIEENITIELLPVKKISHMIERQAQKKIIGALFGCPNGVIRLSTKMPGIVETSTSLSYISTQKDHITIFALQRSLVESEKISIADQVKTIFELAGGRVDQVDSFPCWSTNENSPLLKKASGIYKKVFNKDPKVVAVHAGLECGFLKEKYPNLDILSIGPDICDPHSPDEKVNIPSVEKIWDLLRAILEGL